MTMIQIIVMTATNSWTLNIGRAYLHSDFTEEKTAVQKTAEGHHLEQPRYDWLPLLPPWTPYHICHYIVSPCVLETVRERAEGRASKSEITACKLRYLIRAWQCGFIVISFVHILRREDAIWFKAEFILGKGCPLNFQRVSTL